MSDDTDRFLELITAVADGRSVDWARLESAATSEADRALVSKMKLVAAVKNAHQELSHQTAPSRPSLVNRDTAISRPRKWGRLELFERVGEGAFGEVFRARDTDLEREVALKLFWTGSRSAEALRERFLQEARSLAQIRHHNVAAVYGIEFHDGRLGMWLEFIRGFTLAQIVQMQGRLSALEATLIGLQICDALSAVHAAGFIHCDLKAQNVMREEGGRVVLMDFGAARAIDGANRSIGGTPLYIAPEILQGDAATPRSDIYSLGVILFKLVVDTYPFFGASHDEMREAHAQGESVSVSDFREDLPTMFLETVERALSLSPKERFPHARAMRRSLEGVLSTSLNSRPVASSRPRLPSPRPDSVAAAASRISIFLSYCHEDEALIGKMGIIPYLKDLESDGCEVWSDHSLQTGDEWNGVLMDRLNRSHVLVPLVTQAYLRSRYCQDVEIRAFWSRRLRDGVVLFPIIVSPCEWQRHEWLKTIQFLPRKGTMTTHYRGRGKKDQLLVTALGQLRSIADVLRARQHRSTEA
jgi:serine/threonine protein kinase